LAFEHDLRLPALGYVGRFWCCNMIFVLWDRRWCDGWASNYEMYEKCDVAMFILLVVEMVAVNLGLLVAYVLYPTAQLLFWE